MTMPMHSLLAKRRRAARLSVSLLAIGIAISAGACSDDDDGDNGNGEAGTSGRGGSSGEGGSAGSDSPDGGTSGSSATAGMDGLGGAIGGEGGSTEASGGGAGDGGAAVDGGAAGAGGSSDDLAAFRPEEVPFDRARFDALALPDQFRINVFRSGLGQARMLAVHGPHVYVTQPMQGNVLRLVDDNADGVAETPVAVATGLPMVHGIAFHDDEVFLANVHSVYSGVVAADGSFGTLTPIIADLPDGGQHPLRTLGIGPDELLYISVGSDCDACPEANPEHATLLRSTLTGQAAGVRTIFARGLRNTIGFGWHPGTDGLWGMDHGSDWRGGNLPPEELNAIQAGNDYGWPYCYAEQVADPIIQDPPLETKAEYCADTSAPTLLNQAHQAPIGLTFYTGATFPAHYQNGAFVAFRGSWNRKPPTGYRVAFVPFEAGVPQAFEDFVSGFLSDDGTSTFGRPAGVAVAPDGALLFTDDTNGIVYRVQYEAE